jgi:hypothetical protein
LNSSRENLRTRTEMLGSNPTRDTKLFFHCVLRCR